MKANYTWRNGTEQLRGHTMGSKYIILIFVVVHFRKLGLLLITNLFSCIVNDLLVFF